MDSQQIAPVEMFHTVADKYKERRLFMAAFIGAVSVRVTREDWMKSLKIAEEAMGEKWTTQTTCKES